MKGRKHSGFVWDYNNGYRPGELPLPFIRFEDGTMSLATIEDLRDAGLVIDDVTWMRRADAEKAPVTPRPA